MFHTVSVTSPVGDSSSRALATTTGWEESANAVGARNVSCSPLYVPAERGRRLMSMLLSSTVAVNVAVQFWPACNRSIVNTANELLIASVYVRLGAGTDVIDSTCWFGSLSRMKATVSGI